MIVEAMRRVRAMLWPRTCHHVAARLDAAEATYLASTVRARTAALDLIDETVTGQSPVSTSTERINAITGAVVAMQQARR